MLQSGRPTRVLLVGATGMLGARTAHHLLTEGADLRLLVRDAAASDPAKAASLATLQQAGATVVSRELSDTAAIVAATTGIDVVVSTVQGGADVIVQGQVSLARVAADNGVQRILPSDFALDVFRSPPGLNPMFDMRRQADEAIAEIGIEHVHVLNGAFLDMFLDPRTAGFLDHERGVATYWGTGDEQFDATTVEDTARFTARAALDGAVPSGKFAVAADQLSFGGMTDTVEQLSGRRYARRCLGTVEELRTQLEQAKHSDLDPAHWMQLAYLVLMLTGHAALSDVQTELYPDLRPETFDAYARRIWPTVMMSELAS
ncbi:MAG: NmrA family NAD(P)-binding protein [Actinomycetota bacterium]|nr:NmrA family NAD(P)-binding protein [Actinomycetota bacterium]